MTVDIRKYNPSNDYLSYRINRMGRQGNSYALRPVLLEDWVYEFVIIHKTTVTWFNHAIDDLYECMRKRISYVHFVLFEQSRTCLAAA